jgi:hypothetical protein
MSAIRYSGELRIRVTYVEATYETADHYRCCVSHASNAKGEKYHCIVGVRIVHGSGVGVDSPAMFDEVAQAALSFADNDGFSCDRATMDRELTGWYVGRSRFTAWEKEPTVTFIVNGKKVAS